MESVRWYKDSSDSRGIESVDMTNIPYRSEVFKDITVSGTAEGESLETIIIQKKQPSELGWSDMFSRNCKGRDTCSITKEISRTSSGRVSYQIFVETTEGKMKSSGPQTVNWYEKQERNQQPSIDLRSPSGLNVDTSPTYAWKINDDEDWMEYVKLVIDDDSDVFSDPMQSYDSRYEATMSNRANAVRDYSPIYQDLNEDTRYWWGIKASDGEHAVKEKTSFRTEGKGGRNGDEEPNQQPDADLEVSTVSSSSSHERLKFDASGSSDSDGSIDRYKFDFDGDGDYDRTNYGTGIERKSYYSDFSGYVKVKVYDNDGATDTAREYVNVNLDDDGD
ncbi:MAG: hypothetical protein ABEK16_01530, partial [Candidatus Nanohalobium sp.]